MHFVCPLSTFQVAGKRVVILPYQLLCTATNRGNNKTENLGQIKVVNSVSPHMSQTKELKTQEPHWTSAHRTQQVAVEEKVFTAICTSELFSYPCIYKS